MDRKGIGVSKGLQDIYENEDFSHREIEWRELTAKYKADNILTVCKGRQFGRVLECGAGDGSILKRLDLADAFDQLYGLEISDASIQQTKNKNISKLVEVKKFNGYEIPYVDKEFDMAYCSHVIEHVEHPRILLREIKRVSNYQIFEIPLDYSIKVDRLADHFFSYGHINIYTPSLFKFLLKSENFIIEQELLSSMSDEVLRFSWYKNKNIEKTLLSELKLQLYPIVRFLKKIILGQTICNEYDYQAYTCLTKSGNGIAITTNGRS